MAEQIGPIPFKGRLGNIIGKTVNGKHILSLPGGFTSKGLKDPSKKNYKRVRENYNEFGFSSRMSLAVFRALVAKTSAAHFHSRASSKLTGKMHRYRVFDTQSPRGQRKPTQGALSLLKDHYLSDPNLNPWREQPQLIQSSNTSIEFRISKPSAALKIREEPFPKLRVKSIALQIDFDTLTVINTKETHIDLDLNSSTPIEWSMNLFSENTLIALATTFYLENNGFQYPLSDKSLASIYLANFYL
jgi:hypothetical protein